jgi:peptidyl-prolyl cis-trans isomerase A (cyclophilin A)/peptidyl-prolyl cis-trans isomerase B (cyclophilin B)
MVFALLLATTLASSNDAAAKPAKPRVVLDTTEGKIVLELDREKAPASVENFLAYVKAGHYTGTIFHRVIPGFMIQGGGFTAQFDQKPTAAPVQNESSNGLKNDRGTIAMARTNDPNSATTQFFVNLVNNDFLNYKGTGTGYTVFGKVVEGMSVVEAIGKAPTGAGGPFPKDVPKKTVLIKSASLQ